MDIKNYAEKVHNYVKNRGKPTGLRVTSAYRQPKIKKEE